MTTLIVSLCFGGLTLAILLSLFRLARGPTVLDRILAFDLIATSAVGMVVLLSVLWRTPVYLELIVLFSLLGFVSTVAFVFHLHRAQGLPTADSAGKGDVRPSESRQP